MPSVLKRFLGEPPEVNSEINVIPLIDVILVLLIIFMVVTPMLQIGAAVQLPVAKNPEEIQREERQLIISLRSDLSVYIMEDRYVNNIYEDMSKFISKLKEIYSRDPRRKILVKADRRLTFKDVRTLLRRIQEAGFTNVALVTEKEQS